MNRRGYYRAIRANGGLARQSLELARLLERADAEELELELAPDDVAYADRACDVRAGHCEELAPGYAFFLARLIDADTREPVDTTAGAGLGACELLEADPDGDPYALLLRGELAGDHFAELERRAAGELEARRARARAYWQARG